MLKLRIFVAQKTLVMLHVLAQMLEKIQRKKIQTLLSTHPNVSIGSIRLGIDDQFVLYKNLRKVKIGNSVNIRNYIHVIVQDDATLEIGDRVFMNNFCSINCLDSVTIGENTLFGENVKIYDHNHAYERDGNELTVHHSKFTKAPVVIGKNCWLGSNVTVLKGVTIGDNCIIGAGCTITKSVPPNSTVVNKMDLISRQSV